MPAATGTSGSPNGGRGADLAIFPSIGTHSARLCCSAPHAGTGGHSGRSSAISRETSWTFAMCAKLASLSRRKQSCSRLYCGSFRSFRYFS